MIISQLSNKHTDIHDLSPTNVGTILTTIRNNFQNIEKTKLIKHLFFFVFLKICEAVNQYRTNLIQSDTTFQRRN